MADDHESDEDGVLEGAIEDMEDFMDALAKGLTVPLPRSELEQIRRTYIEAVGRQTLTPNAEKITLDVYNGKNYPSARPMETSFCTGDYRHIFLHWSNIPKGLRGNMTAVMTIWKGIAVHEVGHCYMTQPVDAPWRRWCETHRNNPLSLMIRNIIEDARINDNMISECAGRLRPAADALDQSLKFHSQSWLNGLRNKVKATKRKLKAEGKLWEGRMPNEAVQTLMIMKGMYSRWLGSSVDEFIKEAFPNATPKKLEAINQGAKIINDSRLYTKFPGEIGPAATALYNLLNFYNREDPPAKDDPKAKKRPEVKCPNCGSKDEYVKVDKHTYRCPHCGNEVTIDKEEGEEGSEEDMPDVIPPLPPEAYAEEDEPEKDEGDEGDGGGTGGGESDDEEGEESDEDSTGDGSEGEGGDEDQEGEEGDDSEGQEGDEGTKSKSKPKSKPKGKNKGKKSEDGESSGDDSEEEPEDDGSKSMSGDGDDTDEAGDEDETHTSESEGEGDEDQDEEEAVPKTDLDDDPDPDAPVEEGAAPTSWVPTKEGGEMEESAPDDMKKEYPPEELDTKKIKHEDEEKTTPSDHKGGGGWGGGMEDAADDMPIKVPYTDKDQFETRINRCRPRIAEMKDWLKSNVKESLVKQPYRPNGHLMGHTLARAYVAARSREVKDIYQRYTTKVEQGPVEMVFLSDVSGSVDAQAMQDSLLVMAEAAKQFVPDDGYALFAFGSYFHILKNFEEKYEDVKYRIGMVSDPGSYEHARAFDVIEQVFKQKRLNTEGWKKNTQRVFIVLSDFNLVWHWDRSPDAFDVSRAATLRMMKNEHVIPIFVAHHVDGEAMTKIAVRAIQDRYIKQGCPVNILELPDMTKLPQGIMDIFKKLAQNSGVNPAGRNLV